MQHDDATGELRLGDWLPAQRTEATPPPPGWPTADETMLLPAFVTGSQLSAVTWGAGALPADGEAPAVASTGRVDTDYRSGPEGHKPVKAADPDRLPSSERNMLIFVASLLAAGTIAVIATMGFSTLASSHPTPAVTQTVNPSPSAHPSPSVR